jgi:tetratricopeptide (TPR) repeat protein
MPVLLDLVRRAIPKRLRSRFRGWRAARGVAAPAVSPRAAARESVDGARAASRAKDWPEAVVRWRRLLVQQGDDAPPVAYEQLAHALRRTGDLESAVTILVDGLERHPGDPKLLTQRARLASQGNDWGLAVERWQEVRDAHGDVAPAVVYEQLCRAHRRNRELDEARSAIEEGLARYPTETRLRMEWARLAMAAGHWAEAIARWQELVKGEHDPPAGAFIQLSEAQRRLGQLDAAESTLSEARDVHPTDLDVAVEYAKLAMEARSYDVAIMRWATVGDLFPGDPPAEVHRRIARCHIHLGAYEEAAATVEAGLRIHPSATDLVVERVQVAIHAEDWPRVRRAWDDLRTRHGDQVAAAGFARLARQCVRAQAHDLADEVAEEGMRHHPNASRLHRQYVRNALGRERMQGDPSAWDWREGLTRARDIIRQQGAKTTADDTFDLAYELSESAAIKEAIELLDDGLQRFPTDVRLLDEQATLLSAEGDWQRVIERLDTLATLRDGPEGAYVRLRRSRALRCLGDLEGARAAVNDARRAGLDSLRADLETAQLTAIAGDLSGAVRVWETVIEGTPDAAPATVYRQLAMAHLRTGDLRRSAQVVELARRRGYALERSPGVIAIVGGGPTLRGVDLTPLRGVAHTVAVNATANALPWSDVAVTHDASHLPERFRDYPGPVVAGVPLGYLRRAGHVDSIEHRRRLVAHRLSEDEALLHSGGHTSAYTALNYAYLLRPRLIVLFGIDLRDSWDPEEYWHQKMDEYNRRRLDELQRRASFDDYLEYRSRKVQSAPAVFASVLPQIESASIEVLNASPVSSIECFPKIEPQAAIERCLEVGPSSE